MPDFPNDPATNATTSSATSIPASDSSTESNADFVHRTSTTVGDLRKTYGAHFAPGYQDSDKVGEVLANAGVNTLEDFLKQSKRP